MVGQNGLFFTDVIIYLAAVYIKGLFCRCWIHPSAEEAGMELRLWGFFFLSLLLFIISSMLGFVYANGRHHQGIFVRGIQHMPQALLL